MRMSAFEWIFRVAMLVMAGMVTLSILGSIAAMSNDAGSPGPGAAQQPVLEPAPPVDLNEAAPEAVETATAGNVAAPAAGGGSGTLVAAPPEKEDRTDRWLEAIAYALLALAGLFAIGLLMLWRIARELGRAADAVELSRRTP